MHMFAGLDSYKFINKFNKYPEFIAFLDTDSLFVSLVSPEDLFDSDGKPIIIIRLYSMISTLIDFWKNVAIY